MHHLLRQQPGLRMVDVLVFRVLHPDVPPHAVAVRPVLPKKGCLYAQLNPQDRPARQMLTSDFFSIFNVCQSGSGLPDIRTDAMKCLQASIQGSITFKLKIDTQYRPQTFKHSEGTA